MGIEPKLGSAARLSFIRRERSLRMAELHTWETKYSERPYALRTDTTQ
jgi:hypothetical protein